MNSLKIRFNHKEKFKMFCPHCEKELDASGGCSLADLIVYKTYETLVKHNYNRRDAAKELGVSDRTIVSWIHRIREAGFSVPVSKYTSAPAGKWTIDDERYMREHWGSTTLTDISDTLRRTKQALYSKSRDMGLYCPKGYLKT